MIQDCVSAVRMFRRKPLLTAAAIVCLAPGIGATTAVFSVVDGVLLRKALGTVGHTGILFDLKLFAVMTGDIGPAAKDRGHGIAQMR